MNQYRIERDGDRIFIYCSPDMVDYVTSVIKNVESDIRDSLARSFIADSPYVEYPSMEQWLKKQHQLKKHKKL